MKRIPSFCVQRNRVGCLGTVDKEGNNLDTLLMYILYLPYWWMWINTMTESVWRFHLEYLGQVISVTKESNVSMSENIPFFLSVLSTYCTKQLNGWKQLFFPTPYYIVKVSVWSCHVEIKCRSWHKFLKTGRWFPIDYQGHCIF